MFPDFNAAFGNFPNSALTPGQGYNFPATSPIDLSTTLAQMFADKGITPADFLSNPQAVTNAIAQPTQPMDLGQFLQPTTEVSAKANQGNSPADNLSKSLTGVKAPARSPVHYPGTPGAPNLGHGQVAANRIANLLELARGGVPNQHLTLGSALARR